MNHPYRYLFRRFLLWLRQSFSVLWLILVAGYLIVLGGHAVYGNYQAQQETNDLQSQLNAAQQEEVRLQALLVYYQTDAYKEKELRRTLLLIEPGETVYALPESSNPVPLDQTTSASITSQSTATTASADPIWQQWLRYLWDGEKAS